jgi:hypothetical protein
VVFCHTVLAFDTSAVGRVLAPPLLPTPGGPDKVAKLFLSVFNGETAVMIFFVISGAVLSACSYAKPTMSAGSVERPFVRRGAPSGCGALLRRGARAVPQFPVSGWLGKCIAPATTYPLRPC